MVSKLIRKGKLIGQGMTAQVYSIDNDKILKLYYDYISEKEIIEEYEIGKAVHKVGIPVPAVYDIVDEEGRKGIIFQQIKGKSILKLIEDKPWKIIYYARQMAKLHFKLHTCSIKHIPSEKEKYIYAINKLPDQLKEKKDKLLSYIEKLPSGYCVCHGDFHPDNILVTQSEMCVIDWTDIYSGNPLSDVARTCILIRTPYIPEGTSKLMIFISKILKWILYRSYFKTYKKLAHVKTKDINNWLVPVAAKRLLEKIPGEEKWLLNMIDKRLK